MHLAGASPFLVLLLHSLVSPSAGSMKLSTFALGSAFCALASAAPARAPAVDAAHAQPLQRRCVAETWDKSNLTLAAVRAVPVNWPMPMSNKNWTNVELNLNATVAYGVELIAEASAKGARLIAFPEVNFCLP